MLSSAVILYFVPILFTQNQSPMRFFTAALALCLCFFLVAQTNDIVISEISYNPPEPGPDTYEFVELYNKSANTINLGGYSFSNGFEFAFDAGYQLDAGSYVIIASDGDAFQQAFGISAFTFTSGSLSNGGELIRLVDDMGVEVDAVEYDDSGGWPVGADGNGASLVLCDLEGDNNLSENWADANTPTGVISGGVEIFANPNAASACQDGPTVGFIDGEIEVSEADGTVTVQVAIANGGDADYSVDVQANASSTATIGADASFSPSSLTFLASEGAADTLTVTITLVDDTDVEPLETLQLELANPSGTLVIEGINGKFDVNILDDDAIIPGILISEIMYSPPGLDDQNEYLELYNSDDAPVDLTGFYFSQGIVDTLPSIMLGAGEYLLLTVDSANVSNLYGVTAYQWTSGALSNGGEVIELRDAFGNIVDVVEYDDMGDWPTEPDGGGSSLVLCDLTADNSLGASWSAAVQPTGVFISGTEILGSPGAVNDCTPPNAPTYPMYDIGTVTTNNEVGVPDSINRRAELTGVVYGVNLRPGGLLFTIIDSANDGIAVFSNNQNYGYTVLEGDEVTVQGVITQFSGLTQINADTVWQNSSDNMLVEATEISELNEDTESQLVATAGGMTITTITEAGNGLNVILVDPMDNELLMRVNFPTGITQEFLEGIMGNPVQVTGIGGQFDTDSPFDDGYQIAPRYQEDIQFVDNVDEPAWANEVVLAPVPTQDVVQLQLPVLVERVQVLNQYGQLMATFIQPEQRFVIDANAWPAGMYFVSIQDGNQKMVRRILKQ